MLRLSIGYPSVEVEAEILDTHTAGQPLAEIDSVTDAQGIAEMIKMAQRVHVAPSIRDYIVRIVDATRNHPDVYLGGSPRASIMLLRAARAYAASEERDYVIPDDVKLLGVPGLAHRIIVTADAAMTGRSAPVVVQEVLGQVDVPIAEPS
jgi:MoxR-like ATPase